MDSWQAWNESLGGIRWWSTDNGYRGAGMTAKVGRAGFQYST
jgi:hypothetical protein